MTAAAHRRRAEGVRQLASHEPEGQGRRLRRTILTAVSRATGGDRKLSGLGNRPTIGVRVRVERGNRTTTVELTPSPRAAQGPMRWLDDGTESGQRALRRSLRGGFRPLPGAAERTLSRRDAQIAGRGSYWHPGTSGDRVWSGPTDEALPRIRQDMETAFRALR